MSDGALDVVPSRLVRADAEYEALQARMRRMTNDTTLAHTPEEPQPTPFSVPMDYMSHTKQLRSRHTQHFMSNLREAISCQLSGIPSSGAAAVALATAMKAGPAPFAPLVPLVPSVASQKAKPEKKRKKSISRSGSMKRISRSGSMKRISRSGSTFSITSASNGKNRLRNAGRPSQNRQSNGLSRNPSVSVPKRIHRAPSNKFSRANSILVDGTKTKMGRLKKGLSFRISRDQSMVNEQENEWWDAEENIDPQPKVPKKKKPSQNETNGPQFADKFTDIEEQEPENMAVLPSGPTDQTGSKEFKSQRAKELAVREDNNAMEDNKAMEKNIALEAQLSKERESRLLAQERAQQLHYLLENQRKVQAAVNARLHHPNYFIQGAKEAAEQFRLQLFPMLREAERRLDGIADQFFIPPTNPMLKGASRAMGRAIADNVDELADMLLDDFLADAATNLNRCEERLKQYREAKDNEQTMENVLDLAGRYRTEVESIRKRYLSDVGTAEQHRNTAKPNAIVKDNDAEPLEETTESSQNDHLGWHWGSRGGAYRSEGSDKVEDFTELISGVHEQAGSDTKAISEEERLIEGLMQELRFNEEKTISRLGPKATEDKTKVQAVRVQVSDMTHSDPPKLDTYELSRNTRERQRSVQSSTDWDKMVQEVMQKRDGFINWRKELDGSIEEKLGVSMAKVVSIIAEDLVESSLDQVADEVEGLLDERVSNLIAGEFELPQETIRTS